MYFKCILVLLAITSIIIDVDSFKLKKRAAAAGRTWPVKKIPYAYSNIMEFSFEQRNHIDEVLKRMQESLSVDGDTCIEFVPRNNEKDYVLFYDGDDCSSPIGYYPGINKVSLSQGCHSTGTIMHEVIHKLGFDHEHSRYDRDQHISINLNNAKHKENFEINPMSSFNMSEDTPYDFYSITHYNSNAMQIDPNTPTITSKISALLSDNQELFHNRENLSPIDIYKIQKLYNCKVITIPKIKINEGGLEDVLVKTAKINKRFKLEASLREISNDLMDKYLKKNYETCGMDYYWPADYPLVESKHELYKLICIRKKEVNERCRFSIECKYTDSVCVRPFFQKNGYCVRIFDDPNLNKISQKINDKMFEAGKVVKNTFKSSLGWFKNIITGN